MNLDSGMTPDPNHALPVAGSFSNLNSNLDPGFLSPMVTTTQKMNTNSNRSLNKIRTSPGQEIQSSDRPVNLITNNIQLTKFCDENHVSSITSSSTKRKVNLNVENRIQNFVNLFGGTQTNYVQKSLSSMNISGNIVSGEEDTNGQGGR